MPASRPPSRLGALGIITHPACTNGYLNNIVVSPDFRGQGLGKEMIQWAIQRAKNKGAHMVQLTTDKKRPDAIRFYQDLGFVSSHEGMKLYL